MIEKIKLWLSVKDNQSYALLGISFVGWATILYIAHRGQKKIDSLIEQAIDNEAKWESTRRKSND